MPLPPSLFFDLKCIRVVRKIRMYLLEFGIRPSDPKAHWFKEKYNWDYRYHHYLVLCSGNFAQERNEFRPLKLSLLNFLKNLCPKKRKLHTNPIFFREFFFFFLIFLLFLFLAALVLHFCVLSPVAASGGHSSSRCTGLSPSRPLLLWSTGSRRAGSAVVAHGPSCSAACGIFPDQGSNPCPLHADSQPLRHQGILENRFYLR